MDKAELRKIVEEVVDVLVRKGLVKGSCCCDSPSGITGATAKPGAKAPGPVKVTMGSAGKIFSDSWQKPLSKAAAAQPQAPGARETPAQAERGSLNAEQEHTHCPSCPHCESLAHLGEKELKALGADRIAACQPTKKCSSVARFVDHTLLKPNATQEEVAKLCEEAKAYCFASVCVNPSYVPFCAKKLSGSGVKVCTVVGFPLGSTTATVKSIEARDAIANGADEIDMVINVGALKSGNDSAVYDDIRAVREATRGKVLKVILETALLSQEEKVRACLLAKRAGADFVKTSTGFGGGGATAEDVRLMRETVGPLMGVKASGGIRDAASAQKMIEAGATRLGTSASVAIVTDAKVEGKGY